MPLDCQSHTTLHMGIHTVVQPIAQIQGFSLFCMFVQDLCKPVDDLVDVWLVAFERGQRVRVGDWTPVLPVRVLITNGNQSCLCGAYTRQPRVRTASIENKD